MTLTRDNALKLQIENILTASCRKKGLIYQKNKNETLFEIYTEGIDGFISNFAEELFNNYKEEKAGKRKPFLTLPGGLQKAVRSAFKKRINSFFRKLYFKRIQRALMKDNFLFSLESENPDNLESGLMFDAARPASVNNFWEPPDPYTQTPEDIVMEFEICKIFDQEHKKLRQEGIDGDLYFITIEFFRDGHNDGLTRPQENAVLSKKLKESSKRIREIKSRARKKLREGISEKVEELEQTKIYMAKKAEKAKAFKMVSDSELLECYRNVNVEKEPISSKTLKDFSAEEIAEMTAEYCARERFSCQTQAEALDFSIKEYLWDWNISDLEEAA
ncbi:conserved hypothetical protein [delta proteobacterium NaphS2]|nr:conserved hypothetical protein [delta proteobacterium NaphS2]